MSSLERILSYVQPIAHLLEDPTITEVMVNQGGRRVFVEQGGRVHEVRGITIEEKTLTVAIQQIARACGEDVTEDRPLLDARLEDGSRVAAVGTPCAVDGAILTIRRFGRRYTLENLFDEGMLTGAQLSWLSRQITDRQTVLIAGGTGTGKTTFLNALAARIPQAARVALLEDTSEIYLAHTNLIRFEVRRAQDHVSAVTMADLLRTVLRHRPDRIIVGEVRGTEAFDLLQALNTGHRGSLTTIHANSASEALERLARCVVQSGIAWPYESVREAIAEVIQVVVHLERREDGRRVVSEVCVVRRYDRATGVFALDAAAVVDTLTGVSS